MAKQRTPKGQRAPRSRKPAKPPHRAIEATQFRLVDRNGRLRAVLEMSRSGPHLAMLHEDGTPALELALSRDGPCVRLTDGDGATRVFVGATRGSARIGMADDEGTQRVFLGVGAKGTPGLTLYDGHQRRVWTTVAHRLQD